MARTPMLAAAATLLLALSCCHAVAAAEFPFLACQNRQAGTVFTVGDPVAAAESNVFCFPLTVGVVPVANQQGKCAGASLLEKAVFWIPYSLRSRVTRVNLRDDTGMNKVVSPVFTKNPNAPVPAPMLDVLMVTKLWYNASYIAAQHPRICLKLASYATLDGLCSGAANKCSVALWSQGNDAKCCPTYPVAVPA